MPRDSTPALGERLRVAVRTARRDLLEPVTGFQVASVHSQAGGDELAGRRDLTWIVAQAAASSLGRAAATARRWRFAEPGGEAADLQGVVEGLQEGAVGGVRERLVEGLPRTTVPRPPSARSWCGRRGARRRAGSPRGRRLPLTSSRMLSGVRPARLAMSAIVARSSSLTRKMVAEGSVWSSSSSAETSARGRLVDRRSNSSRKVPSSSGPISEASSIRSYRWTESSSRLQPGARSRNVKVWSLMACGGQRVTDRLDPLGLVLSISGEPLTENGGHLPASLPGQ